MAPVDFTWIRRTVVVTAFAVSATMSAQSAEEKEEVLGAGASLGVERLAAVVQPLSIGRREVVGRAGVAGQREDEVVRRPDVPVDPPRDPAGCEIADDRARRDLGGPPRGSPGCRSCCHLRSLLRSVRVVAPRRRTC